MRPAVAIVADDRRLGVQPAGQLLPVAPDDEQAVVDRQPEPEDRHHVDREHRHLGDQREQVQRGERAEDGDHADHQRQGGRDDRAEHQHEQHQQHRHRQRLGPGDVLAHLLVDVPPDRRRAADLGLQPGRGQPVLDPFQRVGALLLVPVQGQHRVGGVPVGADQAGRAGAEPAHGPGDRVGRQRGQRAGHRLPVRRVVDRTVRAAVEHDHVGVVPAEVGRGDGGGPGALAAGILEAAAGQPAEHAGPPGHGHGQERRRGGQHQPPPPVCEPAQHLGHRGPPGLDSLTDVNTVYP